MRSLSILCAVVGALAGLLAACETAPVTGRSQMMLVGESEERQMGLQAYRDVLSKEQLSEDAKANANTGPHKAEWLSTHPADTTRIADIKRWLPEAMKYYRPQ